MIDVSVVQSLFPSPLRIFKDMRIFFKYAFVDFFQISKNKQHQTEKGPSWSSSQTATEEFPVNSEELLEDNKYISLYSCLVSSLTVDIK